MPLIYIVAGEASGDVLGARLIAALNALRPGLTFQGVGGPRMHEQGLASLFPLADLAVMGIVEVIPRLRLLRQRLHQIQAQIEQTRPDLLVTIDSPGFTHRILKANPNTPRAHYVAPQVWAWREHRVKHYPGLWDKLLCLLPFEPAWFAQHGLDATFVGHPVLESGAGNGNAHRFRTRHNLAPNQPILILMPGSRRSEAPRLLPVFGQTLARLAPELPGLVPVLPVSPIVHEAVRQAAQSWPTPPIITTTLEDKHDAYAAAGAALTKSGTSTLELALAGVPMAVTYRVNPISAALARRMIRVDHVAMVNLLANRRLVPELLQQDCNPTSLAETVLTLLRDPQAAQTQREGFIPLLASLHPGPNLPSQTAAQELLAMLPP